MGVRMSPLGVHATRPGGPTSQPDTAASPGVTIDPPRRPVAVAGLVAPTGAAPHPRPVRRVIDNHLMAGLSRARDSVGDIARSVTAYNHGLRGKPLPQRLAELHGIEHAVYAWFSAQHQPDLGAHPIATRLKSLLTAVTTELEGIVNRSLHDPTADPPVAGFGDLPARDQERVRRVWTDLVAGTGAVRITETQDYDSTDDGTPRQRSHPGFRVQVLTSFARLLGAEFGRRLVTEVTHAAGANVVTIRPGLATAVDDVPAEELLASATDAAGAALIEFTAADWFGRRQHGSKAWRRRQAELDRCYPLSTLDPAQDEATRMAALHRARPVPIKGGGRTAGFSVMDGDRRRYYRFGAGSSSTITYTADLADGSDSPMSRFVDEDGNEIIVPVFISLGHELGHALHTLNGAQSGGAQSLEPIAGAGLNPGDYSGTLEEIVTIRGVENPLRQEHGITARHSHHNVISLTCQRIRTGELARAFTAVDQLPGDLGQPVERMLLGVDRRLGARDVPAARRELQAALRALTNAQRQLAARTQAAADAAPQPTHTWGQLFAGWFG